MVKGAFCFHPGKVERRAAPTPGQAEWGLQMAKDSDHPFRTFSMCHTDWWQYFPSWGCEAAHQMRMCESPKCRAWQMVHLLKHLTHRLENPSSICRTCMRMLDTVAEAGESLAALWPANLLGELQTSEIPNLTGVSVRGLTPEVVL